MKLELRLLNGFLLILPLLAWNLAIGSRLTQEAITSDAYSPKWLLAPDSAWSQSVAGLLAPHLTPFLSFLGIALVCNAWPYGVISAVFVFFHTWHGIQNL